MCIYVVLVCSSAGDSPGLCFCLFVFVLICLFCCDSENKEEESEPDWDDPQFVKEAEYLFGVFIYENGLPFRPFNSPSWKNWAKKAVPKMKIIGRDRLAGDILDRVGSDTEEMVDKVMFCLYLFYFFFF